LVTKWFPIVANTTSSSAPSLTPRAAAFSACCAAAKHIRLLRSAGLVVSRREGTASRCSLNARPLRAVDGWLRNYEAFWAETLQGLKSYMENKR
jgi:hypothetical protein